MVLAFRDYQMIPKKSERFLGERRTVCDRLRRQEFFGSKRIRSTLPAALIAAAGFLLRAHTLHRALPRGRLPTRGLRRRQMHPRAAIANKGEGVAGERNAVLAAV